MSQLCPCQFPRQRRRTRRRIVAPLEKRPLRVVKLLHSLLGRMEVSSSIQFSIVSSCSMSSSNALIFSWKPPYGMGHKKVPVFCKTTTVQRKCCVPFPCPFRSTYYRVYFCCVGKIILSTWNGEQTVKKTVKRTLYVCKAGARKLLVSKELPISKNGDGV